MLKIFFKKKSPTQLANNNKRVVIKSFGRQMDMFSNNQVREGETRPGKHGMLIVKRNPSGHGGHLERLDKEIESGQQLKNNTEGKKNLGAVITAEQAYEILSKQLGDKIMIVPHAEEEVYGGRLKTINENSDGTTNIFMQTDKGEEILRVPRNQTIVKENGRIVIHYADRDVEISLSGKKKSEETIKETTSLLPHVIAERILSEKMKVASPEDEDKFNAIVEEMVRSAEDKFQNDKGFRENIIKDSEEGRKDALEEFFDFYVEEKGYNTQPKNHELTQDDFVRKTLPLYAKHGVRKGEIKKIGEGWNKVVNTRKHHERIVESALQEGKPVPDNVLEDYPKLREKYQTNLKSNSLDNQDKSLLKIVHPTKKLSLSKAI